MHTLLFATHNENKVAELKAILPENLRIISLKTAGISRAIEEPFDTLEENAREKSRVILALTGQDCFSEDTGLEVDCLNGEPGVRSARYAGEEANHQKNIEKLLSAMSGITDRKARFRTVISLQWEGEEYLFEGICDGRISENIKGEKGFGYDPVFIPDGTSKTFAEMDIQEKSVYSHRAKATAKLVEWLKANFA